MLFGPFAYLIKFTAALPLRDPSYSYHYYCCCNVIEYWNPINAGRWSEEMLEERKINNFNWIVRNIIIINMCTFCVSKNTARLRLIFTSKRTRNVEVGHRMHACNAMNLHVCEERGMKTLRIAALYCFVVWTHLQSVCSATLATGCCNSIRVARLLIRKQVHLYARLRHSIVAVMNVSIVFGRKQQAQRHFVMKVNKRARAYYTKRITHSWSHSHAHTLT